MVVRRQQGADPRGVEKFEVAKVRVHGRDAVAADRVRQNAAEFVEPVGVELPGERNDAAVTDLVDSVAPADVDDLTSSIWPAFSRCPWCSGSDRSSVLDRRR
jgi:hypothetical protein